MSNFWGALQEPGGVSFSTGTFFDSEGKDLRWAMHLADERMYKAKEQFYKENPKKTDPIITL